MEVKFMDSCDSHGRSMMCSVLYDYAIRTQLSVR